MAYVTGFIIAYSQNIDFATYSTTEEIEAGTWVDGKTIYKKTIYRNSINAGEIDIVHGINNLDLCVKLEAFEIAASHTTLQLPALANTSEGNYASPWVIGPTTIKLFCSLPLTDVYITLYYTKTS